MSDETNGPDFDAAERHERVRAVLEKYAHEGGLFGELRDGIRTLLDDAAALREQVARLERERDAYFGKLSAAHKTIGTLQELVESQAAELAALAASTPPSAGPLRDDSPFPEPDFSPHGTIPAKVIPSRLSRATPPSAGQPEGE